MRTSDFDYNLPPERIAQEPARPRDSSRLLVLDRRTGQTEHRIFREIDDFLRPGDLLVVNQSRVFKARLMGSVDVPKPVGARRAVPLRVGTVDVEIFLLRPEGSLWIALAKPGRKLKPGTTLTIGNATATVTDKREDGTVVLDFGIPTEEVFTLADRVGQVPLPPYIKTPVSDAAEYQTVYADPIGSVAAPTAGLHFTPELMERLKANGVRFASVTLHVGLGTFRPIKTDTVEEHDIHEEWIDVPDETVKLVEETKASGGRIVAVGTTTVRALEGAAKAAIPLPPLSRGPILTGPENIKSPLSKGVGRFAAHSGFTKIFITPGYRFKIVDAMVTNFHLPKSSLLVLVSAFVGEGREDADWGRRTTLGAYREAIEKEYRFYSFGDAMLIE